MNIAFVNEHFGMGGLERVSSFIGEGISSQEKVYFYSCFSDENFFDIKENFIDGRDFLSKKPLLNTLRNKTIRLVDMIKGNEYNPAKILKYSILKLVRFIKENEINVIVISSPLLISCIPFIKEKVDVRTIAWLHNTYEVYMNDYAKPFINSFVKGLKHSNGAVCLTESDLSKYKLLNNKVKCIYNPLTIESEGKSDLKKKVISFTGRYAFKHKGIDFLVKIAKELPPEWQISVAGTGTSEEIKKFKSLIKENKLDKKIVLRGPLKGKQLSEHYINSSIYLMTSRWEGFGLVLVEAMNFGLPIIAFEQSGSKEVLDGGRYGIIVENGNLAEMIKAIKKMATYESIREKYQKLSLKRVHDFDVGNITKEWIKYIQELD